MFKIDITRKGYYEVWNLDTDSQISQHSDPYKAAVRCLEEKANGVNAIVKQPNLEPTVEGLQVDENLIFLTQEEFDAIEPENKIYAIKKL